MITCLVFCANKFVLILTSTLQVDVTSQLTEPGESHCQT